MNVISSPNLETLLSEIDDFLRRAGSALSDMGTGSAKFSDLISKIPALENELESLITDLTAVSGDPLAMRPQVREARLQLRELDDEMDRLNDIRTRLTEAQEAALAREMEKARQDRYDAVRKKTDELVAEMGHVKQHIAAIVAFNKKLMHLNEQVHEVNRDLPKDTDKLLQPEAVARGLADNGFGIGCRRTSEVLRLTECILPDLDSDDLEALAWPPIQNVTTRSRIIRELLGEEAVWNCWRHANGQ
ncbi:MAG: hypothetical protein AAF484_09505 [Pseudomonadota bacterium]